MYGNIIGYYTNMKPNLQIVILNGKTTGGEKGSPKLKKKMQYHLFEIVFIYGMEVVYSQHKLD
jgi:hypothetical protein